MAAQQTLEELVESENQPMLDYASAQLKPIIPSNAKTLIIVLGQCLEIDSGKADPTLIERCERAYKALNDFNLDLSTTYWIVSGSDVSNMRYKQKYGKLPEIRQASEGAVMKQIICNVYDNTNENKENNNNNDEKNDNFSDHVIIENKALTTEQNFLFTFKMIYESNLCDKIENIFIVTSDHHCKRSKYCFETVFFDVNSKEKEKQKWINNNKFDIEKNLQFAECVTDWKGDEKKKKERADKENELYNMKCLQKRIEQTSKILWDWRRAQEK